MTKSAISSMRILYKLSALRILGPSVLIPRHPYTAMRWQPLNLTGNMLMSEEC